MKCSFFFNVHFKHQVFCGWPYAHFHKQPKKPSSDQTKFESSDQNSDQIETDADRVHQKSGQTQTNVRSNADQSDHRSPFKIGFGQDPDKIQTKTWTKFRDPQINSGQIHTKNTTKTDTACQIRTRIQTKSQIYV